MKPFSVRLNAFVWLWFKDNRKLFKVYKKSQFNFDDVTETFTIFTEHFKKYGTIPMWYDDNEDNIFADCEINAKFRAWHDYIHVVNGFDFSLCGEVKSYVAQVKSLPKDWKYERQLMEAEIVGQGIHYTQSNEPIQSQRDFAINYISVNYGNS